MYSLWGEGVPSADSLDDDENTNIAAPSIDSVTQLWSDIPEDIDDDSDELDVSAYEGMEWWDQLTEDGGSLRKSGRPDLLVDCVFPTLHFERTVSDARR